MYGLHRPWHGWDLRLDGNVFVEAIFEQGDRHRTGGPGSRQVVSANWVMAMAKRAVGTGRVGLRTMFSAEPITIPGCGALNLLSTGGECAGDTIHDRQQAHDLAMEIAVDYDRPLVGQWRWQIYGGLAGSPALGPPSYAHRPSATGNPIRPIGHHWVDSTSTTFGVVTVGVFSRLLKYEASLFNGTDADERRIDLDLGKLDSVATRISLLPTDSLAFQLSAGRVQETSSIFRVKNRATKVTTSAIYQRAISTDGTWATTVAFGLNEGIELVAGIPLEIRSSTVLIESSVFGPRQTLFGRVERMAMPAHHLHAHEYFAAVYPVGKAQVGYVWQFPTWKGVVSGIGGTVAVSLLPTAYAPRYSGRVAPSFSVFLSVRPARHAM